ncbi:MAG: carboxypeptidase regulatory-like domain-containing protein [Kofleriaceae bacterium]
MQRFATGRLVEAHHYSSKERARRWVRAHRAGVIATATAAIAIAVAGGIGVASTLHQRDAAIVQRTTAERENALLMEEQGRQELVAGQTTRALAWLNAAYQAGDTSDALRFMLGTALHRVESLEHAFRCNGSVGSIQLSTNERELLVACSDEIVVWRLADGTRVSTLSGKTDGATYSHDGKLIASKTGALLTLWNATTGERVFMKREHHDRIEDMRFTPDDRLLVTSGNDRMVRVWDVATGEVKRTIEVGTQTINVVRDELTPDGKRFLSTLSDGSIGSYDIATGARVSAFKLPVQSFTQLSHDGMRLAACGTDGTIRIANLQTGEIVQSFIGHARAAMFTCEFSRDDRRLITSGADGFAKVWDLPTASLVVSVPYNGVLEAVPAQLSDDGERLITAGAGTLSIWHVETGSLLVAFDDPFGLGNQLALSHDGHRVITVREPATVVVFRDLDRDLATRRLRLGHELVEDGTSPLGTQFLLKDSTGKLEIVDAATLAQLNHAEITPPFVWSGDGSRLAAKTPTGDYVVLDAHTGATIATFATAQVPDRLELDTSGRRLLLASARPEIVDVDANRKLLELTGAAHAQGLSQSGARVVAWADGRALQVWDVDRRAVVARIALDADVIEILGFDRDERRVIVNKREGQTSLNMLLPIAQIAAFDVSTGVQLYSESGRLVTLLDASHRWAATYGLGSHLQVLDAATGTPHGDYVAGATPYMVGQALPDGELVVNLNDPTSLYGLSIRNARDGRLLAFQHLAVQDVAFTQDSFNANAYGVDISSDGRTIVTQGRHPVVWRLPREERSPAEVDRVVREHIRWRIVEGKLLPLEAKLGGRVTFSDKPVAGAAITLEFEGVGYQAHATTDADGRFSFGVRSGTYKLTATSPDGNARHPNRRARTR